MPTVDTPLPKALEALAESIVDRELAARLRATWHAAARCIEQLQAINLVALEPTEADDGSADLSSWEKLATPVRDTVVAVNALGAVMEEQFPRGSTSSGVFAQEASDERTDAEAALVFHAVADALKKAVTEVAGLMRRPELMGSRWALVGELQRLRAHLRARVGDAVYLSAAACGPVRREDVVPGTHQEVQRALLFRTTAADLRRSIEVRLEKAAVDLPRTMASLDSDFELFSTMPAWRHVRAEAKRQMLALRSDLAQARRRPGVTLYDLEALLLPVVELLNTLAQELTQAWLLAHDREAWTRASQKINQARLHLELGTGAAARAFAAALDDADTLRGRDDSFDATLRLLKKDSAAELTSDELQARATQLRQGLSRVAPA